MKGAWPGIDLARRLSIVAILVLGSAACGGGGASPASPAQASPASAQPSAATSGPAGAAPEPSRGSTGAAEACAQVEAFRTSVEDLLAIDPATVTREELRQASDTVVDSWVELRSTLLALATERREELEEAYDQLEEAIDRLPPDMPIRESLEAVRPEARALATAVREAVEDLGCP